MPLTRFSVPPLHTVTRSLAAVAMGREAPDLVITGARLLSTYTERVHPAREIWVRKPGSMTPAAASSPPASSTRTSTSRAR
jgi:adenine deaminase